jgi:glycosyltransferase 2 family protein
LQTLAEKFLLPFSICRYHGKEPNIHFEKLTKNSTWLTFTRLPYSHDLINFMDDLLEKKKGGILIDGCNERFANYLASNGFKILSIGKEAILDIQKDHFKKKSLKELIKRGLRQKIFEEISYSTEMRNRLRNFQAKCSHGKEPQLKYLFSGEFKPFFRLFVLKDENDKWYGAFMLSNKENNFAQTELILRRRNAPVGVMEALIFSIFNRLKNEKYEFWSLGAVPFTVYDDKLLTMEGMINFIGRRLRFAYNYKGLYFFKNKFSPTWIEYYFCIKPKLTFYVLVKVLIKTNLHKLIINKLPVTLPFRIINKG